MRPIDADAFSNKMYYEAFENDASYNESNPMAKWDSGLWIRYKLFENAIDEAPTIEPKRGEWIEMYRNGFGNIICACSKCNFHATKSNFCPNCGARMKGADDE